MGEIYNIPLDLVNSSERDSISQSNTKLFKRDYRIGTNRLECDNNQLPKIFAHARIVEGEPELQRIETKEIKRAFHNDNQDTANSNFSFFFFPFSKFKRSALNH
jgi:hypothetical protein